MSYQPRILTIDDEPVITQMLKLFLEAAGFAVRGENDPTKALQVAREFSPDLILLDYRMPRLNGCEVARFFTADYALRHVPIAFMSGSPKEEILLRTRPRDFQVFPTPLHMAMIVECVTHLVGARNKYRNSIRS